MLRPGLRAGHRLPALSGELAACNYGAKYEQQAPFFALLHRYDSPPPTLKILYNGEHIAELKREDNRYTFRYLDAFRRLALQPLPGLDPDKLYEGAELPLYFRERMPDTRRPDVLRLMQQFRIPENDSLFLLATLGRHTVTDPFEFQLSAA